MGLRFFSEDYYIIAFLDVDVATHPSLKKLIEDEQARITLQPDLLYGYSTILYYEKASGVFSATGADYHLIDAMKDASTLNLIVSGDAGRIANLSLDDVDYAIPLSGSRKAIETLSNCIK